ncbi:unannotated protein [freshwater metagenome]|uniref:Unannotated protein n=1 Tax=freshwater metagenome TaxID=449393 RepID=A0A6J6PGH8_9ZZZZ
MTDLSSNVHRVAVCFDRIEEFGERLPCPRKAYSQDIARDVFDRFHCCDEHFVISWASRCETNAAKAKHDSGDPVPVAGGEGVVKEDLTVIMRVNVDKSGGHDATRCVDLLCTGIGDGSPHLGENAIGD